MNNNADLSRADNGHVLERMTNTDVLHDSEAEHGHHSCETERRRHKESH